MTKTKVAVIIQRAAIVEALSCASVSGERTLPFIETLISSMSWPGLSRVSGERTLPFIETAITFAAGEKCCRKK